MKSTIKLERQYTAPYKRGSLVIALLLLCLTLSGVVVAQADVEVSGHVYLDANANGHRENDEGGTELTLWANLVDKDNNVINIQVDSVTGEYTFDNVTEAGSPYSIVISDNSTATNTPMEKPVGYIGTEFSSFVRSVVVNSSYVYNQNFGLFKGSRLSGTVFKDTGAGGGIANDGIKDVDEKGIPGVNIKVTNSDSSVTYATTTDSEGNYAVYITGSFGDGLEVTETNPSGYLSTGGSLNSDTSKYVSSSDTISFTFDPDIAAYEKINFGDVPQSTFTLDGNRTVVPGGAVFFPHVFTAGTDGTVTFSTSNTSTPNNSGWTHLIYSYEDTNNNGVWDPSETLTLVTPSMPVNAGDKIHLLIKENAPANVTDGAQDVIEITANFVLTNPLSLVTPITETLKRNDVTNVNSQTELSLVKQVDKDNANKGEQLTYTITYTNNSDQPIENLVIKDFVPAFTTFVSAAHGTTPTDLTIPTGPNQGITHPTEPVGGNPGGVGVITWTFDGELAPGQSGSVNFVVKVDE